MKIPCPQCGGLANQGHHKFPQTVDNIEAYGKKLIDADWNIVEYCSQCHSSHNKVKPGHMWDEFHFRFMLRQNGINTDDYLGTKSYKGLYDEAEEAG